MITDVTLRVVVTVLFGYAAAYCIVRLLTPLSTVRRVDHLVHLAMAVAMIAMAWPAASSFALTPLGVFFALATGWFVVRAVTSRDHARTCGYHAAMMAAMVWMYAVMAGWTGGSDHDGHSGDMPGMNMSGMNMSGMNMSDMSGMDHSTGAAAWVSGLSLALAVAFAVAALVWLSALFTARPRNVWSEKGPGSPTTAEPRVTMRTAALACEVAMAAGMSVMMAVLV